MDKDKSNSLSIVTALMVLLGAVLALAGVFLAWTDFFGITTSGWEMAMNVFKGYSMPNYAWYMPLVVLMVAVSAVINALAAAIRPTKGGAGAGIFSGIIVLVAVILFVNEFTTNLAGIGVWVCAAGAVLMVLFGIIKTVKA